MKTDEEMMASLLKRAAVYEKKKKQRMKIYTGTIMSLALLTVFVMPTFFNRTKKAESEGVYEITDHSVKDSSIQGITNANSPDCFFELIGIDETESLDQNIRKIIENGEYQENEIIQFNEKEYFTVITIDGSKYIVISSETDYETFSKSVENYKKTIE